MNLSDMTDASYSRTDIYIDGSKDKPKYMFVVLGDKVESCIVNNNNPSLLDVGGAAGAFTYYMSLRFAGLKLTCLDADKSLIEKANKQISNVRFVHGDANNMVGLGTSEFDIVTMTGTMSIFDDFRPSLGECIRVCKNKGRVLVTGQFNEYPVDALIKWRYSGDTDKYNPGYNLFSRKSVSEYLNGLERVKEWKFEKFILPFDLKK